LSGRYRHIQALARGLEVLSALNEMQGGTGSIVELSRRTNLHRTTIKRILETLRACGFVRQSAGSNRYNLTFRVRKLSSGFRDEDWISQTAAPFMLELTQRVLWPSDILTLDGDELIIRESTHSYSRLSFHHGMVGERLPLLDTAAGRAYLAFCPPREREALLELLRGRDDYQGERARNQRAVRTMLRATKVRGYAVNEGDWIGGGQFGAIAVPVITRRRVLASLNLIFSKRVIKPAAAADRYLSALTETARKIAKALPSETKKSVALGHQTRIDLRSIP
jgi:IclR family mhp operon transcriptional activator